MKKKTMFLSVCLLLPLSGCSSSNAATSAATSTFSDSQEETTSQGTIISSSDADPLSYEAFWTYATSAKIALKFTNAALHALSDYGYNYSQKYADVYFPATFTATVGEQTFTYEEVGVRMKGATSRTEICSSDGTISDVCHLKVSFKCTFSGDLYELSQFSSFAHDWTADPAGKKARKNRTFAGMGKLDLKYLPRNVNDQTYSQDIYCYDAFNKQGVQAPHARWVDLTLKDDKATKKQSYEAVESIDEDFLSHHFGENGGDLYKCTQVILSKSGMGGASYTKADLSLSGAVTSSFDSKGYANGTRVAKGYIGVEDNYNLYHPNYSLKTNDDNGESSDFSKMANLLNVAYSLRYKSAPYSLLESTLDVDEFLNFEAVSYLLGNFDDQRNNYNNYYVYFRHSDNKAVYIPYDWDYSLGGYNNSNNDISDFGAFYQGTTHDSKNGNNLYWDTILTNSSLSYAENQKSLQNAYKADINAAVNNGIVRFTNYQSFLSKLANRLTSSTEESTVSSYMAKKNKTI